MKHYATNVPLATLTSTRIHPKEGTKYKQGMDYTKLCSQIAMDSPKFQDFKELSKMELFPDSSLLDPINDAQHREIKRSVRIMIRNDSSNSSLAEYQDRF